MCQFAGNSNTLATSAIGQGLVGFRVPVNVVPAATATSSGPEALAFSQSPSFAAELERLAPAPPGSRWVGYVSAVTSYSSAGGPQRINLEIFSKLPQGADGSPFRVPGGDRPEGRRAPGGAERAREPARLMRPSLTSVFDDDPGPGTAGVICVDDETHFTNHLRDLGILGAGARASGQAGTLAILPYTLRYAGNAVPGADYALTAASTLPGATLAVTPGSLLPAPDSDSQALVAVGIPAGARPATYDVTLTARLANGQTRRGVGRLTVLGAPRWRGGRRRPTGRAVAARHGASAAPVRGAGARAGNRRPDRVERARHRPGAAVPGRRQEAEGGQGRSPARARADPRRAEEQGAP